MAVRRLRKLIKDIIKVDGYSMERVLHELELSIDEIFDLLANVKSVNKYNKAEFRIAQLHSRVCG